MHVAVMSTIDWRLLRLQRGGRADSLITSTLSKTKRCHSSLPVVYSIRNKPTESNVFTFVIPE